jgi:hypothetical protein
MSVRLVQRGDGDGRRRLLADAIEHGLKAALAASKDDHVGYISNLTLASKEATELLISPRPVTR